MTCTEYSSFKLTGLQSSTIQLLQLSYEDPHFGECAYLLGILYKILSAAGKGHGLGCLVRVAAKTYVCAVDALPYTGAYLR